MYRMHMWQGCGAHGRAGLMPDRHGQPYDFESIGNLCGWIISLQIGILILVMWMVIQ